MEACFSWLNICNTQVLQPQDWSVLFLSNNKHGLDPVRILINYSFIEVTLKILDNESICLLKQNKQAFIFAIFSSFFHKETFFVSFHKVGRQKEQFLLFSSAHPQVSSVTVSLCKMLRGVTVKSEAYMTLKMFNILAQR